jgi:hypothetical protein
LVGLIPQLNNVELRFSIFWGTSKALLQPFLPSKYLRFKQHAEKSKSGTEWATKNNEFAVIVINR